MRRLACAFLVHTQQSPVFVPKNKGQLALACSYFNPINWLSFFSAIGCRKTKLYILQVLSGADPGYLERGFICIKVLGFALLILSIFS